MDGTANQELESSIEVLVDAPGWRESVEDIERVVRRGAALALQAGNRELCILLADDATLRKLNARFRGKDHPTNVLTFPAPPSQSGPLGDVALAFETVAREAKEQGKTFLSHTQHLVVHGVLHLLGFDHETDAEALIMEAMETRLLRSLGVSDPYGSPQGDN